MRHRIAVLVAASTMALGALSIGVLPAAAAENCANWNTCSWTQINNSNWQPNSNMDPDCHSSCDTWTQDCSYRLPYYDSLNSNVFVNDVTWAVNTWNAVPECSPSYSATNDSQNWNVEFTAAPLSTNPLWCGSTFPQGGYTSGNVFVLSQMIVQLNSNAAYYDGPVPSNAPANSCNLKTALLHETGHTLGEGHSSVQSDIMYPYNGNNATAIDADAHHMLAAIYGEPSPSGCNSCQFDIAGLNWGVPPVRTMGANAFLQALANKEQSVHNEVSSADAGEGSTVNNLKQDAMCAGEAIGGNACG